MVSDDKFFQFRKWRFPITALNTCALLLTKKTTSMLIYNVISGKEPSSEMLTRQSQNPKWTKRVIVIM